MVKFLYANFNFSHLMFLNYLKIFSTISSGLNSLAVMLLEDFVLMLRPNMSSKTKMIFSKVAGKLKLFDFFSFFIKNKFWGSNVVEKRKILAAVFTNHV